MPSRVFFTWVMWGVLAVSASAWAEDKNSALDTTEMRGRLARLREQPPAGLKPGVVISIAHVLEVAERIRESFPQDAPEWHTRAKRYLDAAEQGKDPFIQEGELGRIVSRGYKSPISKKIQGYTVYVPPGYSPDKSWPLMIILHGGSSNGNLFLGVVLGNNMSWLEYDKHLWHRYEPRWYPNWIIAAPDGYGQVLWRYMGEQDVLDVISDIQEHYNVDPNRIALGGLSNGGMGAYAIGSRHAWRFSIVQAMAGSPSWIFYAGESSVVEPEIKMLKALSAYDLAENWVNTDFRYYHGHTDPGPMRPAYIHRLDQSLDERGIPHRNQWYDAGHDLLYIVHRHGKIYNDLEGVRRKQKPRDVIVVSGDYRAARQHWLEITRFQNYPDLARVEAHVNGSTIEVKTSNVDAFAIDLRDVPLEGTDVELKIDGTVVHKGKRNELGHRIHAVRASSWKLGVPEDKGLVKRPHMSGPISDAYFDRMIHVYGSQNSEHTEDLKKIAEKGARGWPLWLWTVDQEVVADRDLTAEQKANGHLVLYGTPGDNSVLEAIQKDLPIRVQGENIVLGAKTFSGKGLGTRFIYPNPQNPDRYVIVQTAPTVDGVRRGHNLPDFVPDYAIYDQSSTGARARLVPSKALVSRGYFDAHWQSTLR